MIKKALAALFFALIAAHASATSFSCTGTACSLPATCVVGDTWGRTEAYGLLFFCRGSNTWQPAGPSGILAIQKSVDINSTNVDIPLVMPSGRYFARSILITGASTSLAATAARVGIWTGAGATGANIVTAASSATVLQSLTTTATVAEGNLGIQVTSSLSQVFLRVTVAHGTAATIDVYILGEILP
jgi:hypothetical protein